MCDSTGKVLRQCLAEDKCRHSLPYFECEVSHLLKYIGPAVFVHRANNSVRICGCICELALMLVFIFQSATFSLGYHATRSEQHGHHSS